MMKLVIDISFCGECPYRANYFDDDSKIICPKLKKILSKNQLVPQECPILIDNVIK